MRVLPWRPRRRVMDPGRFREALDPDVVDLDPGAIVVGLVMFAALWVLTPVIVVVLAVLLFSVELPLVVLISLLLVLPRFVGLLPWTVVTLDPVTGAESAESHRFLPAAVRRVREANHDRRVRVRWAWS